jgi:hypothetical protein
MFVSAGLISDWFSGRGSSSDRKDDSDSGSASSTFLDSGIADISSGIADISSGIADISSGISDFGRTDSDGSGSGRRDPSGGDRGGGRK